MRVLMISNIFSSDANPYGGSFINSRALALESQGVSVLQVATGLVPPGEACRRPDRMIDGTVEAGPIPRTRVRIRGRVAKLEVEATERIAQAVDLHAIDAVMAH